MAALDMGVSAGVDYAVEINQYDDNFFGAVKRAFPKELGWIPDDLATLDSDSPERKREKNMTGGMVLGLTGHMIEAAARLAKGLRGIDRATQWIPESEKAKN
jgi:hypothetical protein